MKRFTTVVVGACLFLDSALFGCGSSSDDSPRRPGHPTQRSTSSSEHRRRRRTRPASQVCDARADIQTQVETLTTLSTGNATKADVTSALAAITADVQKIKDAQAELTPERKQQVQDAVTAFETQLKDIVPAGRRRAGYDRRRDAGRGRGRSTEDGGDRVAAADRLLKPG